MSAIRLFDIVVASLGIVMAAPFMAVIAIVIKLESRGPVLYGCTRVGLNGELFKMWKFRTMVDTADKVDCKLCCGSDVRVTASGRLLRRTKLNELPQLFNVVTGEMSLVGPRPEDPKFTKVYEDKWKIVLSVRPGIAGPNQVNNRNEEDLFPPDVNPETFYIEHILPEKLDKDIEFVRARSLSGDIWLLTRAFIATVFRGRVRSLFGGGWKSIISLGMDAALSVFAYLLAYVIRFESLPALGDLVNNGIFILVINPLLFVVMGLYRRSSRFFSIPDVFFVAKLSLIAGACFIIANRLLIPQSGHSRAMFVMYPIILFGLIVSVRLILRINAERSTGRSVAADALKNVLIYGSGRMGVETARQLRFEHDLRIVGFADDDTRLSGSSILGMKVLGTGNDLPFLKELYDIDRVIIAFRSVNNGSLEQARKRCQAAGIPEVMVTSFSPPASDKAPATRTTLRKLRLSDELGMPQIPLMESSADQMDGSTVALIGGGDGTGEHLCREMHRLGVEKTIVVDSCPARLRQLQDRLLLHSRKVEGVETAYQPWGLHDRIQYVLEAYNVNWIVCHHLFRPAAVSCTGSTNLMIADFIDLTRYVRMAENLGCQGFTLVSPVNWDSFTEDQKSFHHLCEQYMSYAAQRTEVGSRSAVIRVPNILEDENGIFQRELRALSTNPFTKIPQNPLRFSSARYTARTILNCIPLHDGAKTYVQTASLRSAVRPLLENYLRIMAEEHEVKAQAKPDSEQCITAWRGSSHERDTAPTSLDHVHMILEPEQPDLDRWESETAQFQVYLSTSERRDIEDFFLHMRHTANLAARSSSSSRGAPEIRRPVAI